MQDMNWWAVLVSAFAAFAVGGLWYSPPLFLRAWMAEARIEVEPKHPPRVFLVSFVFALVSAIALAALLGPAPTLASALVKSLAVGTCLVATSFGINYQFSSHSTKLLLIDGGYHVARFLLMGLVLGVWH